MKYITIPIETTQRLSFYLAMEEFVAHRFKHESECFFTWQVNPSVIFGRNQLIENEVNVNFCKRNNIQMFRRKSGGGCVYADMDNIMFSYISTSEQIGFTFHKYINLVVFLLRKLGVDACGNTRNDIIVDGKKVSGNAFYHVPGKAIVHGTMLFDTDMDKMLGAITPDTTKLESNGIESVRQRVALLKDYIDITIDEFKTFVKNTICQDEILLSNDDVNIIRDIEKEYLSDEFIYGNNPKYKIVKKQHIQGVGNMEARMQLKNGVIKSLNILGDYLLVSDIDALLDDIKGTYCSYEELSKVVPDNMENIIFNLKKHDFINFLIK